MAPTAAGSLFRRGGLRLVGLTNAVGERVPLPEQIDVLSGGVSVQLEQRESIGEWFAKNEPPHAAAITRRLEKSPERLECLLDLMPYSCGESESLTDRLHDFPNEQQRLTDSQPRPTSLLFMLDRIDYDRKQHHRPEDSVRDLLSVGDGTVEYLEHLPEVVGFSFGDQAEQLRHERFKEASIDEQLDRIERPSASKKLEQLF